jgi:Hypothetical glycosyl hydrolase family 15
MRNVKIVAVLAAVAAVGGMLGIRSPNPATAASSGITPGIGLVHLGDSLSSASNQNRYPMVVVSQDDAATAAALPGNSLVYFAAPDVNTQWNSGVTYSQAVSNGWLLTSGGALMLNRSFSSDYIGDIGSTGYQNAWISNVSASLASSKADGVFIDDVVRDPSTLAGRYPDKYPTQAAWEAAMVSFVKAVGTALRAKGYYVLVNASGYTPGNSGSDNGSLTAQFWQELGPYVNGLCTEYYQETSDGSYTLRSSGSSSWMQNWDGWQKLVTTAQNLGDDFVGMTYGATGDTRTMLYGDASFLMEWNGRGGAYMFDPIDNSDPWNPVWTTGIGTPTAAKQAVGTGWMRFYSGGVALVNPSPSTSQTFQLGGTYLNSSGQSVTSVTLSPTTGMLLQATAQTAPASVPSTTTTVAAPTTVTTTDTSTVGNTPPPPPPPPTTTTTAAVPATTSTTTATQPTTTTITTTSTTATASTTATSGSTSKTRGSGHRSIRHSTRRS